MCPAAKTVKIAVPILTFEDDEVFIKMSPAIQRTFHNADEWATFKNDCELSFVVEDATGRQVSFFPDLISGCTYSGQARPSTGLAQRIGNEEGENRRRVNAAEDELGQALVRLVAEEEGVSVADVMPVRRVQGTRWVQGAVWIINLTIAGKGNFSECQS